MSHFNNSFIQFNNRISSIQRAVSDGNITKMWKESKEKFGPNCLLAKCPPMHLLAKCPLAKCPLTKCPLAKCPLAKWALVKCPGFILYTLSQGSIRVKKRIHFSITRARLQGAPTAHLRSEDWTSSYWGGGGGGGAM